MSGSLSEYAAGKLLAHSLGITSWTMPTTLALALCTVAPDSTKTGATITEATYTGYARLVMTPGTDWASEVAGTPESITTAIAKAFAACTGGSSNIVGWAILDSATIGAGNVIHWGSMTSTPVSTSQTPATFAAGALTCTLQAA
jgi:hypothetical protein